MLLSPYYDNNTMLAEVQGLVDETGALATGGTGTAQLVSAAGVNIGSAVPFTEPVPGTYRALIPHTTDPGTPGVEIRCYGIITVGASRFEAHARCLVAERKLV